MVFHEYLKGNFKSASSKFQGCFKEVLRASYGCFQGSSKKFQGFLKRVLRVSQASF